MLGVVLLELLRVYTEVFVPLDFWDSFTVVRRVSGISILRAVSYVMSRDLASIATISLR